VFGGTSGIGLATVQKLQAAGADVVAISRTPKPSIALSGVTLRACDVTDEEQLKQLFAAEAPFDILISAATGGGRALGPFLEMDMKGYRDSFAKLWGYANVVRYGGPLVSKGGSVVLVSGSPARRPKPGQVALACVGASVEQLTRTVAPEFAARGVRINVVSPGVIATPMFGPESGERQAKLEAATAKSLIPRAGTAEEVADGIMFVTTNPFVTGTTVDVDGGWLAAP